MAEYAQPQISSVELRLSELQTQIDGLSVALQQWRQMEAHAQPMELRLAQLTEQSAQIVDRWRETEERHTEVVADLEERLSEWGAIESRLQHDSGERIRELERTIEHEWQTLRQIHEEPVKQLREQAATLGETCVAAANLALRGFERAESRIAALEQDVQGRMTQLSRDLQQAIAGLQSSAGPKAQSLPAPGSVSAFPLESVMRIHEELRESDDAAVDPAATLTDGATGLPARARPDAGASRPVLQLPEAAAALTARMESLERAVGEARVSAARPSGAWPSYPAIGLLVVALAGASAFALWTQRRAEARLNDAAARIEAAERQTQTATELASTRLAATREEAGRQVAEARQSAANAQVVGNVLAAPDLVRYRLTGTEGAPRAYAQVLWSRSRGLVFSASRLPTPGARSTYQFWLLTAGAPVSAGLLTPDAAGRVTIATDVPPRVPRRVTGAAVTLEPAGGSPRPAGAAVLARIN